MARRWSGVSVLLACVGYPVLYVAASLLWLQHYARIVVHQQGLEGKDYMVGVGVPLWWYALLVLPPLVLVGWWIARRRRS